jgi:hypothetical protein
MFGAGTLAWLDAVALTSAFAIGFALAASSPTWARVDWSRFDPSRPVLPLLDRARVRALRGRQRPH